MCRWRSYVAVVTYMAANSAGVDAMALARCPKQAGDKASSQGNRFASSGRRWWSAVALATVLRWSPLSESELSEMLPSLLPQCLAVFAARNRMAHLDQPGLLFVRSLGRTARSSRIHWKDPG